MKRLIGLLIIAALLLVPGMAVAQAPAGGQAQPKAQPEAQPQAQPQQPQAGPGISCPMMTPEQMKQMQGKMGQCCMMQEGKGCPMHQQMQKQIDELRQRVEALEGKKKGKK